MLRLIKMKVNVIEEGIQQGKYIDNVDTTYNNLKKFQYFIYKDFKMSEHYDQLRPVSNKKYIKFYH